MTTDYEALLRMVRVACGLEGGGYYNAAKLFWAAVFSQEIRGVSDRKLAPGSDDLNAEMDAAIAALEAAGGAEHLVDAMRAGQVGVLANRTIAFEEVPDVSVCRVCGEIMLGEMPDHCATCDADRLTFHDVSPVYFFDAMTPADVLEALQSAPAKTASFLGDLTDGQLSQSPQPGEWSIRETLWHILVAEELFVARIQKMLAEHNPSLDGLASWTVTSKEDRTAHQILESYRSLRQEVLAQLLIMDDRGWWRTGLHEEWGQVTILQQAIYFARHERSHWAQIMAARRAVSGG
jgi:uncharacterized damage-inducible protein DinB